MYNFINYLLKKLSPVWSVMLAVYFLAVSAFSGSALAQGTDLRLNNPTSANQGHPVASVAYNSATKEYLVIWRDDRGGFLEVYGQRVNQANVLVGNNIKITGGRNGISHAITYVGSTNQYLVVYERVVTIGVSDLWLQRVNADGSLPAQGYFQVVSAGNETSFPSIAYNAAADECLLVWTKNLLDPQPGDGQIYGQRLTKTGNPIGIPFLISTSTANMVANDVAVVSAGTVSNSYLVCWEKDMNIWAQRVNGTNGTLMGGNFPITQTGSVALTPRIAFNAKGNEFLLVWDDNRNHPGYAEIYGQRLGGASGTQGASFSISGFDSVNKHGIGEFSVAYNYQNNSYLTIWEEWGLQSYNIRAQHLSSNGSLLGNAFTINDTPIQEITFGGWDGTSVVYNVANNHFLTIWADSRSGNDYDIYSDLINGSAESLTLIAPNGGETWQADTQHEIKWTSTNFNKNVRLWLSYDGYAPQAWVAVDGMQSTPNDGSYMWTVPNHPSTNCVIKVVDAADGNPWDDSDAPFTITAPTQSLTVTSPNGGEKWQVGSSHNITWSSQNLSNPVKIAYSIDSGSSYTTIAVSTSNDGSYPWKIPNKPSTNCLVRISDVTDGSPSDVSDAVFEIKVSSGAPDIAVNPNAIGASVASGASAVESFTISNSGNADLTFDISGAKWEKMPGSARDIGVGDDGETWVIGTNKITYGYDIYRWTGTEWNGTPGAAMTIDVGSQNQIVVVNDADEIFQWDGSNWQPLPGKARQVSIASDGTLWAIGKNAVFGGFEILKWNGLGWDLMPGGAVKIGVGSKNHIWCVSDLNLIYRWNGSDWDLIPGVGSDISVGSDGEVWVVSSITTTGGNEIFRWNGTDWGKQPAGAVAIGVGSASHIWDVNDVGEIYRWKSSGLGLPAWLDVTPLTGTITPGGQKDIKVTLDAASLTPDTYFVDLFVNSNDPDEPVVQIPVTLEVLTATDVEEAHSANTPDRFYLFQNYPNPFNPETSISFELPDAQKDQTHVGLFIYNMQGQLVRQLVNENKSPGAYSIKWDAKNDLGEKVPSGIYVYTLTAGDFKTSRKMLLLK